MSTILIARDALLACIRAASADFTTTNCAADDWSVLDSSASVNGYAAVVEIGGPTLEGYDLEDRGEIDTYQEIHTFKVTVAAKVGTGAGGYAALITGLITEVEEVKDYIRAHNRLGVGGVVARAQSVQTGPILERIPRVQGPGASPTHFLQAITVKVWCEAPEPANDGGGW